MNVIAVSNVGKAYKQYATRWSRLLEWLDPRGRDRHQLHWVLRNINFTVARGEAVGIVGVNGAGKSTLLKMITGTTQPTSGDIKIAGTVAALLELGMGFHPDFTGRQNAIMAGQLLGHTVDEINQMMPEIEAFAEIGEYIDSPVRVYSSGMQVRLAFSVATVRAPDILIVDEALSVGDAYFQHKSFQRIRELKALGTTLLIVSHDKGAIQSICDKAILLARGELLYEGKPQAVLDYYNAAIVDNKNHTITQIPKDDGSVQTISGTQKARILSVKLLNEDGLDVELIGVGQKVVVQIDIEITAEIEDLVVGYLIKDKLGQEVFGTNSFHHEQIISNLSSGQRFSYNYKFSASIGPGAYSIAVALHKTDSHLSENYEWRDMAKIFTVINTSKKSFIGSAWVEPTLEIEHE